MTVEELLKKISAEELTEWQGFERLEPFGQMPLRKQLSIFTSIFYNAIPTKRRRKTVPPDYFVIGETDYLTGEKPKQSMIQMKTILNWMVGKKDEHR